MGIVNKEKLAKHIAGWVKDYCSSNGTKTVVIPVFTQDPQLTHGAMLIATILQKNRTANSPNVLAVVDDGSDLSNILSKLEVTARYFQSGGTVRDKAIYSADLAEQKGGIVIGSLNRTYSRLDRRHGKYDTALADIFPLLDMYYSEVRELFIHFYPEEQQGQLDDLQTDLERADREEDKTGIITSETSPVKSRTWFAYTMSQKQAIAKLHQREKQTRHKAITGKPYAELRSKGLVV